MTKRALYKTYEKSSELTFHNQGFTLSVNPNNFE